MSNYYNLDGIKTELKKNIEKTEELLKAWECVTYPTKKDGKPFAVMSKNIDGAKYQPISYAMQPGEYELHITVWTKLSGYITDSICCYTLVKDLKDDVKIKKIENYQPKQTYFEQVYTYDLEDIKNAVNTKIEYYKNRLVMLNKEFEIVDSCYTAFYEGYTKLIEELSNNCCKAGTVGYTEGRNDIFYMIKDTVLKRP